MIKIGKRSVLIFILLSGFAIWVNAQKRPIIGISDTYKDGTNAAVPRSYINAVLQNGGIPVVIPLMSDDNELIELLNSLDGVIFTGGEDFDPAYYNERPIPQMGRVNAPRDKFDIKLLLLAAERGIPVLGICRGVQLINIAFGGSLYQDLPAQYPDKSIQHRQKQSNSEPSHAVIVEDNTIFANIVKDARIMVNSSHHQAIKDVARGFRVAGKSPDKIIEVIEKIDDENWILGVQFHPEMLVTNNLAMRSIFRHFIEEASNTNSNRTDKPIVASRPPIDRDPSFNNRTASTTPPQIVYRTVIDTQYIYKQVRDTVFISVPETKYMYVTDTVYLADTLENKPIVIASLSDTVRVPAIMVTKADTINTPAVLVSKSDTLIFTPGDPTLITPTKKSEISSSNNKREEKEKAKQAKKEAGKKSDQNKKEMIANAKQNANELKEKEKFEKKLADAKEKQFRQQQKENAKLDKQELKASKKKEKEQQKNK